MYNPQYVKKLIVVNIAQALIDFCSIQPDIDESKIQAAELTAQTIDLKRLIGKANVERCIDPINLDDPPTEADENLRELVIPVIAHFTYARLLRMYPGTFTDSGYIIDKEASDKNVTIQVANEYKSVGESLMEEVFEFLEKETQNNPLVKPESNVPSIRSFGGIEHRATN